MNLFPSVHPLHCGRGGDDQYVKTTSGCNPWRTELHSPWLPSSVMHTYIHAQTYQKNLHTSTWPLCTKPAHIQSGANSQRIDGGSFKSRSLFLTMYYEFGSEFCERVCRNHVALQTPSLRENGSETNSTPPYLFHFFCSLQLWIAKNEEMSCGDEDTKKGMSEKEKLRN